MFKYEPEKQYDDTWKHIVCHLQLISSKFTLVAELTKCYNLHFHGMIYLTKGPKEFYSLFRNDIQVGFVNIKQTTNDKGWIEYISKEFTKTKNAIQRRPIIRDYYDMFDEEQSMNFGTQF